MCSVEKCYYCDISEYWFLWVFDKHIDLTFTLVNIVASDPYKPIFTSSQVQNWQLFSFDGQLVAIFVCALFSSSISNVIFVSA